MTTLTIKFKNRKQALLVKKFAEDLNGVEEINFSDEKKKNGAGKDEHFLNEYGVTEKEFYERIRLAEEDIKHGRVLTMKQLEKKMKKVYEKDT
ncbi:MAG: hypothetical protein ABIO46_06765 [Chitinophagales bacterium]